MKGHISEIFISFQGEGPFNGERQIFLRLAGCPLRCDYCDTPESLWAADGQLRATEDVVHDVIRLARENAIKTVSVTGGEPLSQAAFLAEVLPAFKRAGLTLYLETAGIHPDALQSILAWVDVVAMDIKLPSSGRRAWWDEHERFLSIAREKAFVKIVLEAHSNLAELKMALSLLKNMANPPLLILQPVTPVNGNIRPPTEIQLAEMASLAREYLPKVFVIPQLHRVWGIR